MADSLRVAIACLLIALPVVIMTVVDRVRWRRLRARERVELPERVVFTIPPGGSASPGMLPFVLRGYVSHGERADDGTVTVTFTRPDVALRGGG